MVQQNGIRRPSSGDPAMRSMTGYTPSVAAMDVLGVQDLAGMTSKAVVIHRFDAGMRFMAFVAIEPRHGDLGRERCPGGGTMAGQTSFPVGDEHTGLLRRKRMTHSTGRLFHAHPVDLPILMTPQAGGLVGMEGMHCFLVAILACQLLDIDMAGVAC